MNKLKISVCSLLFFVLSFTSCGECYYIENELHGMWQVISVERRSTGEIIAPQGQLYYSFQRTMVMLSDVDLEQPNMLKRYIAHFDLTMDSIGMGGFRKRTTGEGNFVNQETKIPLVDLHEFGLYQDYTLFHVEQSKEALILSSDSACIVLRKY